MGEYRVTFGQQYPREPHPTLALAHHDGWVAILAPDYSAARAETVRLLGTAWSDLYSPEEGGGPDLDFYPLGCLLTIQAPTNGAAVYLLTGTLEGEDVLVHVWPDGTGAVALRSGPSSWGPPSRLEPAP